MRKIISLLKKPELWIFILATFISAGACIVSFALALHTSNFDAMSRLNIARKIVDNLTPGLGQFGSVWPFLPQLLMVPFVAITPFWHTGIAGAILSGTSFVLGAVFFYKIIREITKSKIALAVGMLMYLTNINLLLLQTMAMSESLFITLILGSMYGLLRWRKDPLHNILSLSFAAACAAGASLTRYEGIAYSFAAIGAVFAIVIVQKHGRKAAEGLAVMFGSLALFGVFLWSLYNFAIFHDPFYWAKIYAGTSSIISTDIPKTKTTTDADLKKHVTPFSFKAEQYGESILEMNGIPIALIGLLAVVFFLAFTRPWKNSESYILFLPVSIIGFLLFSLFGNGIPVVVPQLTLQNLLNFQTNYGFEYNIRYGILLWPFVVSMIVWLISRHWALKVLSVGILALHLSLPFVHKYFLIYQLPLKWSTGSANSHSEDQATAWMQANYDGGEILISALKHDPVMFQMNIPYKNFIHEGAGKYWLTSRTQPQKYATWIFMADPHNGIGGIGGEEDSVTKYLQYDTTLNNYFDEVYNDGVIAIYKKRAKIGATVKAHNTWNIRSIDTMKLSRDQAGVDLSQVTPNVVSVLNQIKQWNANYVAIDTPYDEKFYPYLKLWTDAAHKLGLHVWFRGNWSSWEGWFGFPKNMTRQEHLQQTYAFIKSHPDLFQDGDSFTACPECENGGPGDPRTTGDIQGYNQFMVDTYNVTGRAFREIGKNVYNNWYSVNGDIAKEVITPNTVAATGGLITIDNYVDPSEMKKDISYLIQKDNAQVLIGEYGTSNSTKLTQILQVASSFGSNVLGVNYWVNIGGSTGLIDDATGAIRPTATVLSNFYATPEFSGQVVDEKGHPLAGVTLTDSNKTKTVTNANGFYSMQIKPQVDSFVFSRKDKQPLRLTLDLTKSDPAGYRIVLKNLPAVTFFQKILRVI